MLVQQDHELVCQALDVRLSCSNGLPVDGHQVHSYVTEAVFGGVQISIEVFCLRDWPCHRLRLKSDGLQVFSLN